MATEWYYSKGGQQHGPVSPQELKNLAQDGTLQSRDLVWKDGMTDWVPVTQIKGLLSIPAVQRPGVGHIVQAPTLGVSRRRGRSQAGQVVLIITSLTMIGAMCSPWWSFRLKETGDKDYLDSTKGRWAKVAARDMLSSSRGEAERELDRIDRQTETTDSAKRKERRERIAFWKIVKKDRKWWNKHLKKKSEPFEDRLEDEAESVDDDDKLTLSMTLWGWSEGGIAIMGCAFGGSLLFLIILFLCIPPIRNWNWIVSVIATAMAVVALVFSILWVLDAPGKDAGDSFTQGIIVGPYLLLGASGVAVLTGILDTIFGISALVRNRRLR